jgi:hypothetical protein
VKFRSRVAAVAAAAGLAAGLIAFGGGTAHASATLLDCSHVAGTGVLKPALTNSPQVVAASIKATNFGTCTGSIHTLAGNITKMSGKLTGSASCAQPSNSDPLDPQDGKIGVTYSNTDPLTLKLYASSEYVRTKTGATADGIDVANGIVTKGLGVGADVYGSFLYQPTLKKGPEPQSTIDSNGDIVPGTESANIGLACALGSGNIATVIFGTDGTSLLGGAHDGALGIVLPDA